MFHDLAAKIAAEYSGVLAKEQVVQINHWDRYFTFANFRRSGRYCAEQLEQFGLSEVECLEYAADGRTAYGDWIIPRAWDVEDAVLRIVEPARSAGELARWANVPHSLSMYSAPTPPEGLTAEVVWLSEKPSEEELQKADLAGKILYSTARPGDLKPLAIRHGALGFISGCGRREVYDATPWDNYALAVRNDEGLFGFMLSPRRQDQLERALLDAARRGETLRAFVQVRSRLYDGTVPVVTAVLPGETEEEVIGLAHLYEAGANDNSSGCGTLIEAMRTLQTLVERGELPRPKRRIRILLGFECCGFMAYWVNHQDLLPRLVAGINLDMVGANQERSECFLSVIETPHTQPSYTGTLLAHLVEALIARQDPLWRWKRVPFKYGDNFINDPTLNVPCAALWQHPERFYHSSEDSPDKVDPASLQKVGEVTTTYLYFLAQAGPREALWLAHEVAAEAKKELIGEASRWIERQVGKEEEGREAVEVRELRERLSYLRDRQREALYSVQRLLGQVPLPPLHASLETLAAQLDEVMDREIAAAKATVAAATGREAVEGQTPQWTPIEAKAAGMVVHRNVLGTLTLETLPPEARDSCKWGPGWMAAYQQHSWWFDGKRSLLEAARLASQELGALDLEDFIAYVEFLERYGYVRVERR